MCMCVCMCCCKIENGHDLRWGHLHLYVLGFRGDWKALVALFNLIRSYNTGEEWQFQFS